MKTALRTFVLLLLCLGAAGKSRGQTMGAPILKTFPLGAHAFLSDAARQRIYASVPQTNEVAVIDTTTLTVTKTIAVGPEPTEMALSPDGKKLYVTLNQVRLAVIDTGTLTVLPSLPLRDLPEYVAAGLGNRVYCSTLSGLYQVDGTTGAMQALLDQQAAGWALQISPDRKTLYAAGVQDFETGQSGTGLKRYDVSTATPSLEQTNSNTMYYGVDLELSHNGKYLCYTIIARMGTTEEYDPANLTVSYGSFALFGTPGGLTFSPDDAVLYEYSGVMGGRDQVF